MPSLQLSDGLALVYVMRASRYMGRFTSGRVERTGPSGVNVYNRFGELLDYFAGTHIRGWCVFGPDGQRVEGWYEVAPEDSSRIFPRNPAFVPGRCR